MLFRSDFEHCNFLWHTRSRSISSEHSHCDASNAAMASEAARHTSDAVHALQAQYGVDQFTGRLQYYSGIVNPRHVLTSQADVDAAHSLLRDVAQGFSERRAAEVANARWTLAGATHPATGALIATPLRMASW